MKLTGKVVVVTGASMGIGEAVVHRFLREGAAVVLAARDLQRVEAARLRTGVPERTLAVSCDVTSRAQVEALLRAARDRFGRVDVWVNNAGFGVIDTLEHADMAECRRLFATNLIAVMEAMQVVAPVLKQQRAGAIINVASVAGLISTPGLSAYSASKHGVVALSRAARLELERYQVQVNCVCPGFVSTHFNENAVWGDPAKRSPSHGIPPERVAEAVWRAYEKNLRLVVVPWKDHLLVQLSRLLPDVFDGMMMRALRRQWRQERKQNAAAGPGGAG